MARRHWLNSKVSSANRLNPARAQADGPLCGSRGASLVYAEHLDDLDCKRCDELVCTALVLGGPVARRTGCGHEDDNFERATAQVQLEAFGLFLSVDLCVDCLTWALHPCAQGMQWALRNQPKAARHLPLFARFAQLDGRALINLIELAFLAVEWDQFQTSCRCADRGYDAVPELMIEVKTPRIHSQNTVCMRCLPTGVSLLGQYFNRDEHGLTADEYMGLRHKSGPSDDAAALLLLRLAP